MIRYVSEGAATAGGEPVWAAGDDGEYVRLDTRTDLRNHSPTGFSWGYGGSGPAQLALAMTAHATDDETAVEHYQAVKRELVAPADDDEPLEVTSEEIEAVIDDA